MTAPLARAAAVALRRLAGYLRHSDGERYRERQGVADDLDRGVLRAVAEARRDAVMALEELREALGEQNDGPGAVGFVQAHGQSVTLGKDAQPSASMCEDWATAWDAWAEAAS